MVLLIKLVVFDLDNVIIDGEAIDKLTLKLPLKTEYNFSKELPLKKSKKLLKIFH